MSPEQIVNKAIPDADPKKKAELFADILTYGASLVKGAVTIDKSLIEKYFNDREPKKN